MGKLADLTVFDRDVLRVPPAELLGARVVETIVGGTSIFSAQRPGER